jgi:hypothetical protein
MLFRVQKTAEKRVEASRNRLYFSTTFPQGDNNGILDGLMNTHIDVCSQCVDNFKTPLYTLGSNGLGVVIIGYPHHSHGCSEFPTPVIVM